ncbi:MAG: DUF2061 domain-containing protein [bacterium]|nr:DUF2061 domain-containing protein [bacterium]
MIDKPYRSVIKAVSWRVTGTIDTILVSWIITRKFTIAMSIGVIEVFTKLLLYYIHERVWNKIKFGRILQKPPEYNI